MNEIIKNDEMMCSDDFPESLKRFSENINKKNPGLHSENHNLYLLQTTDRDGNVTGEAYGMNLMTNWGFKRIYADNEWFNNTSKAHIFIGNGTDEPVLTNNALYSPIITTGSVYVSGYGNEDLSKYNPETDILCYSRLNYIGYFDYNISGITEDFEITEIGYGKSTTELFTHTKVYDSEGNPSSITKRINERLTIKMYVTYCCKMSIIDELYAKGLYIFISPSAMQIYQYLTSHGSWISCTGRDSDLVIYDETNKSDHLCKSAGLWYNPSVKIEQNTIIYDSISLNSTNFLIQNKQDCVSNVILSGNYFSRNNWGASNYNVIKKINLPEPEELVSYGIRTNSISSSLITDEFGLSSSSLPCTNFNITSLSMYNHITKEWDIEEEFVSDPNTEYNDINYVYGSLYLTFQGKSIKAYVWINTRTDLPITSFNNSNIVLYATDKYWDTSTWELISNLSNVDESLQCKRYYIITNENLKNMLYPQRNMVYHQIITDNRIPYTLPITVRDYPGSSEVRPLTNEKYGWVMSTDTLVYPNTDNGCIYYPITGPGDATIPSYYWRWTTEEGDKLIFAGRIYDSTTKMYDLYIRIYDTKNPYQQPTYVDIKLDIPEQLNSRNYEMYFYCTDSGILVCKGNNDGQNHYMVIVDIYGVGEGPTQHRVDNVQVHCVLNRTNNVVYSEYGSNGLSYKIYDMKNQTIIDSFLISTNYTFSGIVGWKDFIYVYVKDSSNIYSMFFYNTNTKQLQHLLNAEPNISSLNHALVLSNDECMLIPGPNQSSHSYPTWIFKASDPTNPQILYSGQYSYDSYRIYQISYASQLKYINNNKQLLFINECSPYYTYTDVLVGDIGVFLDSGDNIYTLRSIDHDVRRPNYNIHAGFFSIFNNGVIWLDYYGNLKYYPIENFMHHKIIGTTTTIQSYNNPKQLGGCKFFLSVTNDMNRTSVDDTTTTDEST